MHLSSTLAVFVSSIAYVQAHGLVTSIQGANGVTMPGLGVVDGTPRDVTGQDARPDVPIFNGKNVLGATKAGGPISAEDGVNQFLGQGNGTSAATQGNAAAGGNAAANGKGATLTKGKGNAVGGNAAANAAAGGAKNAQRRAALARRQKKQKQPKQQSNQQGKQQGQQQQQASSQAQNAQTQGGQAQNAQAQGGQAQNAQAQGGQAKDAQAQGAQAQGGQTQGAQAQGGGNLAQGTPTPPGTSETIVADTAGQSQLPTVGQDGVINLTYHQVNGDGAGPLTASVDPTSGGTQESAFQPAQMMAQLPGTGGNDKSNELTDFKLAVQMPQGMKCTGTVGGQQGVCVVRVTNPKFGGSAVFTQDDGSGAASNAGGAQTGATGTTAGA